jgi:hypothetical protein
VREPINEFHYTGPVDHEASTKPQAPLSAETARVVALSAWRMPGRLHRTPHFLYRVKERNLTILDVEYVIKYGKVVSGPTFCGEPHSNYKYYFRADVDGITLKVAFALDATQDYAAGPLVVLITAVWNTPTGCRN